MDFLRYIAIHVMMNDSSARMPLGTCELRVVIAIYCVACRCTSMMVVSQDAWSRAIHSVRDCCHGIVFDSCEGQVEAISNDGTGEGLMRVFRGMQPQEFRR